MFFIAGIHSKVKDLGIIANSTCPICKKRGTLHLFHKYITPHVFFIPTFKLHNDYFAICTSCAAVVTVPPEKGRAIAAGRDMPLGSGGLHKMYKDNINFCRFCGEKLDVHRNYCGNCGKKL